MLPDDVIPGYSVLGTWAVVVTNTNGQSASLPGGFVIVAPLTVTSIAPNTGAQDRTVAVTLTGVGFASGASARLTREADPIYLTIPASNVAVVSPTTITCTFVLPASAAPGPWNVVVTVDGHTASLANGFVIAGPPPTLTSITPNAGTRGTTVTITSLAGTGFQPGATVKLAGTGSPDITATDVVVTSSTKITCTVALPSAATLGPRDVVVMNPDGKSATLSGGFTIALITIVPTTTVPTTTLPTPPPIVTVPGGTGLPTDTNADAKYDDINGNDRSDFADVVLYFNQMSLDRRE